MEKSTRRVVTRAPARTVRVLNLNGVLPHPVEAESKLEADFVRQAALSPITKAMVSQAFKLPVSPKGYTPDFLVATVHDFRVVVEVKLDRKVKENTELFNRAAEYLAERSHHFFVATEKNIRRERVHERALLLLRYSKAVYPKTEKERALDCAHSFKKGVTLGSLLSKTKLRRELIFHLITRKLLTTGHRLSLDDSALVFACTPSEMTDEDFLARWLGVAPWRKNV